MPRGGLTGKSELTNGLLHFEGRKCGLKVTFLSNFHSFKLPAVSGEASDFRVTTATKGKNRGKQAHIASHRARISLRGK